MKFFFHKHAETEFDRAAEYYEDCRHGLGIEFAQEVYATICRTIQFKGKKSDIQLIDGADISYKAHFGVKKRDIGPENTSFGNVKF